MKEIIIKSLIMIIIKLLVINSWTNFIIITKIFIYLLACTNYPQDKIKKNLIIYIGLNQYNNLNI